MVLAKAIPATVWELGKICHEGDGQVLARPNVVAALVLFTSGVITYTDLQYPRRPGGE